MKSRAYEAHELSDADSNPPVPAPYDHDTSVPSSPASSQPPDYVSQPVDTDDEDGYGYRRSSSPAPKKGAYNSRIEQILYENPDLPILITHAGKNHEGGGSYIVYTIRTGVSLC